MILKFYSSPPRGERVAARPDEESWPIEQWFAGLGALVVHHLGDKPPPGASLTGVVGTRNGLSSQD